MPSLPNLGMFRSTQQEGFGDAFLMGIASAAGCAISPRRPDDDSIDWTLSCRLPPRRPKLDVQMKTYSGDDGQGNEIRYPLKRKNYDDLILTELAVHRILILVVVPDEIENWLSLSPESATLRKCAYWVSLRGLPHTENETSVTVGVPRINLFDADALCGIMERINTGTAP